MRHKKEAAVCPSLKEPQVSFITRASHPSEQNELAAGWLQQSPESPAGSLASIPISVVLGKMKQLQRELPPCYLRVKEGGSAVGVCHHKTLSSSALGPVDCSQPCRRLHLNMLVLAVASMGKREEEEMRWWSGLAQVNWWQRMKKNDEEERGRFVFKIWGEEKLVGRTMGS